jgi:hypothetical protein
MHNKPVREKIWAGVFSAPCMYESNGDKSEQKGGGRAPVTQVFFQGILEFSGSFFSDRSQR